MAISLTWLCVGGWANRAAATRKQSGAGLPCPTSGSLELRTQWWKRLKRAPCLLVFSSNPCLSDPDASAIGMLCRRRCCTSLSAPTTYWYIVKHCKCFTTYCYIVMHSKCFTTYCYIVNHSKCITTYCYIVKHSKCFTTYCYIVKHSKCFTMCCYIVKHCKCFSGNGVVNTNLTTSFNVTHRLYQLLHVLLQIKKQWYP